MLYHVMFFLICFIVVYLVYKYIFDDMLKKEKYTKISELVFLTNKFELDKKKMDYKKCLNGVALINAFIISFTIVVIDALKIKIIYCLAIAFVMLMIQIYAFYTLYGKYLNKKWGKKK